MAKRATAQPGRHFSPIKILIMNKKVKCYCGGEIEVPESWANCPPGSEGAFFLSALSKFNLKDARGVFGVKWVFDRDENGTKLNWGVKVVSAMAGSHENFNPSWTVDSRYQYTPMVGITQL